MLCNRITLTLLFLTLCLSSLAGTRRALVIGVGTYEDPEWMKINGDKDVKLVVDMLKLNIFHDIATQGALVGQPRRRQLRVQP